MLTRTSFRSPKTLHLNLMYKVRPLNASSFAKYTVLPSSILQNNCRQSPKRHSCPARIMSNSTVQPEAVVHKIVSAFSVSGASGLYDRARPSYPPAAISHIFSLLHGKENTIVDVGAGTGIFTRMLLPDPENAISKIIAVEPSFGMRQSFADKLVGVKGSEKVECIDGTFWKIPLSDDAVDLVSIAQVPEAHGNEIERVTLTAEQAFHWATPHHTASLDELSRVLKPDGTLVLIWNLEDRNTDWVAQIRDIYEVHEAGTPQYRHGLWKSAFPSPHFELDAPLQYKWTVPTTVQGVVDRVCSKSYITDLDEEEKTKVAEACRKVVENAKKVWIDETNGVFEYPYLTDLYIAHKK